MIHREGLADKSLPETNMNQVLKLNRNVNELQEMRMKCRSRVLDLHKPQIKQHQEEARCDRKSSKNMTKSAKFGFVQSEVYF